MLENCDEFKVSHVYLYFTESVDEFWTKLAVQLRRAPVKILHTSSKALLEARMEDLREIWQFCVLETLEIGGNEVQLGEEEGWQQIQDAVAKVGRMGGKQQLKNSQALKLSSSETMTHRVISAECS